MTGSALYHDLTSHFEALRQAHSYGELARLPVYVQLKERINTLLGTHHLHNRPARGHPGRLRRGAG